MGLLQVRRGEEGRREVRKGEEIKREEGEKKEGRGEELYRNRYWGEVARWIVEWKWTMDGLVYVDGRLSVYD